MGLLGVAHGWEKGGEKAPLLKICDKYPTIVILDTVITYLKKIQKKYKSCDTALEFCWH